MSECRDLEPLLAGYVDGGLSPDQVRTVDHHLARCPRCHRRADEERAASTVLRAHAQALCAAAPAQLRARCAACLCPTVAAGVGGRRIAWAAKRGAVPLAVAATLLIAVAAMFIVAWGGSVEALATQFALDHVKCVQFAATHGTVEAVAAGEGWRRSYGWALNVPRSAADEELELVDVRRCLSVQGFSAHIMYRWRGKPLSVYVLNSAPASEAHAARLVSRLGQGTVIWSDYGRTYAVVAKGTPSDLDRVARYVRAAAR